MLEQSKEYLAAVKSPQRQVEAKFTLNNRVYTGAQLAKLDYDQAIVSGTSYTFGGAYVAGLTVEIKELVEGLMEMMPATAEIGIVVNGKVEYKPLGQFFITDIELDRNANSTKLKLQDGFCRLNGEYKSKLGYRAQLRDVYSEICQSCNIQTTPTNIPSDMIVRSQLNETSYREAIKYVAQMIGSYAIFNRYGQLEMRKVAKISYRVTRDNYIMGGFKRKEVMFRLNGIECELDGESKLSVGSSNGNVAKMKNPMMTQEYLENLFDRVKGFQFYPYSLNFQGDPCLEAGDWIEVEFSKGEYFQAPILVEKLSFDGGLQSEIAANTTGVSDVVYQYKSPLARKVEYLEGRLSADGLTQVYSGLDEPNPAHLKKGDTWFKPNGTDIDILMWDGEKWVVHNSREKFDELEKEFEEVKKEFEENKKTIEENDRLVKESTTAIDDMREKFNQVDNTLESQQGLFEEFGNELRNNISLAEELNRKSSLFESNLSGIQSNTKDLMDSYRGIYDKTRDLDSAMNNIDLAMNNLFVGSKNYVSATLSRKVVGYIGSTNRGMWEISEEYFGELKGKECTFSIEFDIEDCTVETEEIDLNMKKIYSQFKQATAFIEFYDEQGKSYIYGVQKELYVDETTTYNTRQYVTFKLPNKNFILVTVSAYISRLKSGKAELSKPMLVIGNVKNSFIPSTEETETAIVDLSKIETDRQLSELRTEVGRNYVKTADYSRDTTSLKNRLTDVEGYRTKISSLEQTVNGFKTEVADKNKEQDQKYSSLEQTVGSFKSEMVQKNKEQDSKYSGLEQTVNGFKTTVSSVTNEQGTIKNRISALEQTDTAIKSSITAVDKRMDSVVSGTGNIVDANDPINPKTNVIKEGTTAILTPTIFVTADTYFYLNLTEYLIPGAEYRLEFDCEGIQSNDVLVYGLGSEYNPYPMISLVNGKNDNTFIHVGTKTNRLLIDDVPFKQQISDTKKIKLSNFKLTCKGISGAIITTNSNITQTAEGIRSEISQKITAVDGRVTTLNNTLTQTAEGIRSEVTQKISGVDGKISTLGTQVDQTANSWAVKNIKNAKEIVSQINLNGADVYIQGKNIALDGNTHITNGIIKNAHIGDAQITNAKIGNAAITSAKIQDASIVNAKIADATITGAKIQDATITNAKIVNLDAAKITTGYLESDRIKAGSIDATKIKAKSITADKISATSLSAISANLGRITSGYIGNGKSYWDLSTGNFFNTNASNSAVSIGNGKILVSARNTFDSSSASSTSWDSLELNTNFIGLGNSSGYLEIRPNTIGIGGSSGSATILSSGGLRFGYNFNATVDWFKSTDRVKSWYDSTGYRLQSGRLDLSNGSFDTTGGAVQITANSGPVNLQGASANMRNKYNSAYVDCYAQRFSSQSAHSIKTDFEDISMDRLLDAVIKTDIVTFRFKNDTQRNVGFVINDDGKSPYQIDDIIIDDNGKSFNSTTTIGVLFGAIKALTARVEWLESIINNTRLGEMNKWN